MTKIYELIKNLRTLTIILDLVSLIICVINYDTIIKVFKIKL